MSISRINYYQPNTKRIVLVDKGNHVGCKGHNLKRPKLMPGLEEIRLFSEKVN